MIRYRIDIIAIITVLLAVALQIGGVVFSLPWYFLPIVIILVRQVSIIQHNNAHLGIFYSRFLSQLTGRLCSFSNGVIAEFYELHHVRNHHPNNQKFEGKRLDWSSLYAFKGTSFPDKPVGMGYYVLTFPFIALSNCVVGMAQSRGTQLFRRFLISLALTAPVVSWLIWISPFNFFLFFIIPWTLIAFGLGYNNYSTHAGCRYEHRYDVAVDDLAFPFRFLGYNQGYHLEHHLKPKLHWSLLPNLHELIKNEIPPRNIQSFNFRGRPLEDIRDIS
jgi:fatty acid desaturase